MSPRGYSRPPFAPGHTLSKTHGAWSERTWRPIADALVADAVEAAPWLARPLFRWSVEAWATAQARAFLLDQWLDQRATADTPGDLDDEGNPRAAAALSDRMHARAQGLRASLGLDPTSMARLLASFTTVTGGDDVLAALRREGAALVAAHEARAALGAPDDSAAENGSQTPLRGDS